MKEYYKEMWTEAGDTEKNDLVSVEASFNRGKITVINSRRRLTDVRYFTIKIKEELFNNDEMQENLIKSTVSCLSVLWKKYKIKRKSKVFVAGLGNDRVTADSLGGRVIERLKMTSHLYADKSIVDRFGNLCGIKCGVSGTTGIQSYDVLKAVAERITPDIIIAIDVLAASTVENLGVTLQITDSGIEPGGGVGNAKTPLNKNTLDFPVIAVGVPLVIYVKRILAQYLKETTINIDENLSALVVTAKEIDFLINDFSYVISEAINRLCSGNDD